MNKDSNIEAKHLKQSEALWFRPALIWSNSSGTVIIWQTKAYMAEHIIIGFISIFLCTSHVHPKQPVLKLSISDCCSYDIYKELEQSILRRGCKDMYSCSGLMFIMVLLQGKALSALCSEQAFLCYRE